MSLSIVETRDWDDFESRRLAWTALWRQGRRLSFFQSFEWLRICRRHFGEAVTPRILWLKAGRETLGAWPLAAHASSTRLATRRRLAYAPDALAPVIRTADGRLVRLSPAYSAPLGPNPTAVLWYGCRRLAALDDWHQLQLGAVSVDALDFGRTRNALRQAGLATKEAPDTTRSLIDLRRGFQAYWRSRPVALTARLHGLVRELAPRHVRVIAFFGESAGSSAWNDRWLEPFVSLAAGDSPAVEPFRRWFVEMHAAACRHDAVRAMLLLLDDEPAACIYGFACDSRLEVLFEGERGDCRTGENGSTVLTMLRRDFLEGADRTKISCVDLGIEDRARDLAEWETSRMQLWRYTATQAAAWHVAAGRVRRWFDRRA